MSEVKHTPGPWSVDARNAGLFVNAPDGNDTPWVVCEVIGCIGYGPDGQLANAHLIAAAPELLEALKRVDDLMDFTDAPPMFKGLDKQIKDALSKAEGRA